MAMAGGGDGNSGSEVEELVAVHILDDAAPAALGNQRIGAGVRRRDVAFVALQYAPGIGAGQGGDNLRSGSVSSGDSVCGHGLLLWMAGAPRCGWLACDGS